MSIDSAYDRFTMTSFKHPLRIFMFLKRLGLNVEFGKSIDDMVWDNTLFNARLRLNEMCGVEEGLRQTFP